MLIIGTNWDIQGDKAGDHGSGLAALLEISRVLMADRNYKPEFSVIFVAFDAKNDGCAGSKKFVSEYLKPFIIEEHGSTIQVIKTSSPALAITIYQPFSGNVQHRDHIFLFSQELHSDAAEILLRKQPRGL